ncbi:DNA-binding MarR family transcriptional regulator [Variovorax boronicumulans]|uniref:MarR family winged helix-turn-helix transcriptional regulator n=1 Tax=Variovorax boronicumulans TaxID=436515 RepID=UPI0027889895|nr:MarR family transcriptional regulator [Variovorax boronicumulans]MDP9994014.1 DNA-binding MarR family transcriptional regulator [Variovorax boronicumulans]MDQ0005123.1 DNA-binding MarR family transcriptional regulator [Variovorax boronicumulans]
MNKQSKPNLGAARNSAGGSKAKRGRPFEMAATVSNPDLRDAEGGDRQFRQLLYDISIAASKLEAARAHLAGNLGVTSPQYNMVMIIAQYEEPIGLSVSEVAARLHVSNTFVTAEIKKLIALDLVDKMPDPADGRRVLLRLTPQGEERVRALEPELLFVNDHLFQRLGRVDFEHLSRIVASLLDDFARTIGLLEVLGRDGAKNMAQLISIGSPAAAKRAPTRRAR